MESWAHAAARRRLLKNPPPSGTGICCVTTSAPPSGVEAKFSLIPRDCESTMSQIIDGADKMFRRVLPKGRIPHVCIVGAGMAGLRCAELLTKKGIQVTVLEGRGRIGGRLCQSNHLGHIADLGPNWIHGTENNPILDLARRTKTVYMSPPDDSPPLIYDEHGEMLPKHLAGQWVSVVWETVEEANQYSKENTSSIPPNLSLLDFFKRRLRERKVDDAVTKKILALARVWGDIVGEPIETQSLKYFWLEECVGGENLFVAGTYEAVLNLVAKSALAKVDLRLNSKVVGIESVVNGSTKAPSIRLTTSEGSAYIFDEVVMTAPLGWLKKNLVAFRPAIPPRIVEAINHISYGRLEKVYIKFPTAFWLDRSGTPDGPNAFQIQFLSPAYATSTNPSRWSIECVSLAVLPSGLDPATLLFYINGPCAAHVTSLLDPASDPSSNTTAPPSSSLSSPSAGSSPAKSLSPSDLRIIDFFKAYYSLLPNYSPKSTECQPTAVLATNWINDDMAGNGSYTLFQASPDPNKVPGAEERNFDEDIVAIRNGCPERGLWFAGEHTSPFVALGTVTGAYWSGEAVARRLLKAYGVPDDDDEEEEEDSDDDDEE